MALIKCPECGKEVSSSAKSCPNCGYSLKKKNPKILIYSIMGFMVVIAVIIGFLIYNGKPADMDKNTYNLGVMALEITDSYLDAKITSNETREKLDNIKSKLDDTSILSMDISHISTYILLDNLTISSKSHSKDILDARNSLAKYINKSSR